MEVVKVLEQMSDARVEATSQAWPKLQAEPTLGDSIEELNASEEELTALLEQVRGMNASVDVLILGWCEVQAPLPLTSPGCVTAYAVSHPGAGAVLSRLKRCGEPFEAQLARMSGIVVARAQTSVGRLGLVLRRSDKDATLSHSVAATKGSGLGDTALVGVKDSLSVSTRDGMAETSHPLGAGLVIMYMLLNILLLLGLLLLLALVGRFLFYCIGGKQVSCGSLCSFTMIVPPNVQAPPHQQPSPSDELLLCCY